MRLSLVRLQRPAPRLSISDPSKPSSSLGRTRTRRLAHLASTPILKRAGVKQQLKRELESRRVRWSQFLNWARILRRKSVLYAFQALHLDRTVDAGSNTDAAEQAGRRAPAWLILALPGMADTLNDARYLVGVLYSQAFASLVEQEQGFYIARSLQAFLRVGHYIAARDLVQWWCTSERSTALATTNRMLAALSYHPSKTSNRERRTAPVELLHLLRDELRANLEVRGVPPSLQTFWPLFSPLLIPRQGEKAEALLQEMQKLGLERRVELLRAVSRVYALGGNGTRAVELLAEADSLHPPTTSPRNRTTSSAATITRLHSLTNEPPAAIALFKSLPSSARNPHTWSSLFSILRRSKQIDTHTLLSTFDDYLASSHSTPTCELWTNLVVALQRRGNDATVRQLWYQRLRSRTRGGPKEVDATLFGVVLKSFMDGVGPEFDFRTTEDLLHQHLLPSPSAVPSSSFRRGRDATIRVAPTVYILNLLLSSYNHACRPQSVYALFKSYSPKYNISPDAATLSILLDSARYASAAAGNGYGPGSEALRLPFSTSGGGRASSDDWDGRPAWKVASELAWSILEEGWPDSDIKNPMARPSLTSWFSSSPSAPKSTTRPFSATFSPDPPTFPSIHPTLSFFRSLLQLTGYHSTPTSIPLILAWMRELDCVPDRKTLTLAMMYIGEGGPTEADRARLRKWLEDWLGKKAVPGEADIAAMRRGGGPGR